MEIESDRFRQGCQAMLYSTYGRQQRRTSHVCTYRTRVSKSDQTIADRPPPRVRRVEENSVSDLVSVCVVRVRACVCVFVLRLSFFNQYVARRTSHDCVDVVIRTSPHPLAFVAAAAARNDFPWSRRAAAAAAAARLDGRFPGSH